MWGARGGGAFPRARTLVLQRLVPPSGHSKLAPRVWDINQWQRQPTGYPDTQNRIACMVNSVTRTTATRDGYMEHALRCRHKHSHQPRTELGLYHTSSVHSGHAPVAPHGATTDPCRVELHPQGHKQEHAAGCEAANQHQHRVVGQRVGAGRQVSSPHKDGRLSGMDGDTPQAHTLLMMAVAHVEEVECEVHTLCFGGDSHVHSISTHSAPTKQSV